MKYLKNARYNRSVYIMIAILLVFSLVFVAAAQNRNSGNIDNAVKNRYAIEQSRLHDSVDTKAGITKQYLSNSKKLVLSKSAKQYFNLELKTAYSNLVGIGDDILISEFDFDSESYTMNDILFSTYDAKNNYDKLSNEYWWKYMLNESENVCYVDDEKASKSLEICKDIYKIRWIRFSNSEEIPDDVKTIGLFTSTKQNEKVEWVMTIDGFDILEWAEYTTPSYFGSFESERDYFDWNISTSTAYGHGTIRDSDSHSGNMAIYLEESSADYVELSPKLDFTGASEVILDFWYKEKAGEDTHAGADHTGSYNGDAVYYTCDGSYWYLLQSLVGSDSSWTNVNINISADADFCASVNSSFGIKIVQYDTMSSEGMMFDDIAISTDIEIHQNRTLVEETFDNYEVYDYFYETSSYPSGRFTIADDVTAGTSQKMMILDSTSSTQLNQLITFKDFSNTDSVILGFMYSAPSDGGLAGVDHSGTYNSDAVYYTCDESYWYNVYNFVVTPTTYGRWIEINLSADPDWCGDISSSFGVKFTQYDNAPWTSDGIAINYVGLIVNDTFQNNSIEKIFTEDFELGYDHTERWGGFNWNTVEIGDVVANSGHYSMQMSGLAGARQVVSNMDFSNLTSMKIKYSVYGNDNEGAAGIDHVGTYNGNGFYYTCDGNNWSLVDNLGVGSVVYNIYGWKDFISDVPMSNCAEINSSFAIKWAQYDNSVWTLNDGLAIDDILIWGDGAIFYNENLYHEDFSSLDDWQLQTQNDFSLAGISTAYSGILDDSSFLLHSSGGDPLNQLISKIDFSQYGNIADFILKFYYYNPSDNSNEPVDHLGMHKSGGLFYSCDGDYWRSIYSLTTYSTLVDEIELNLSADSDWCSSLDENFRIKFTQEDTTAWPSDGIWLDSIIIRNTTSIEVPYNEVNFYKHSPEQKLNTNTVDFNMYVSSKGNIANVSLFIDDVLNVTNTSLIENENYTFDDLSLSVGNHSWYYLSCKTDGDCYQSDNYSLSINNYSMEILYPTTSNSTDNTTSLIQVVINIISGITNITSGFDISSIFISDVEINDTEDRDMVSYPIFFEDFEDDWVTTTNYYTTSAGNIASIGNFSYADNYNGDYMWAATSYVTDVYDGTYSLILDDFDTGSPYSKNRGIFYNFNPSIACNDSSCDQILLSLWFKDRGIDSAEYCWISEAVGDNNIPNPVITLNDGVTTYTEFQYNLSLEALSSDNVTIGLTCDMSSTTDVANIDNFNITGFSDGGWFSYSDGWKGNIDADIGLSGFQNLSIDVNYDDFILNDLQESAIEYLILDDTSPTYSDDQINSTQIGQSILFSILYNDNLALNPDGQYIFSTNNTGTWVNESSVDFTETPSWANVTKVLTNNFGISIGYRWYVTDSNGNRNDSEIFSLTTTDAIVPSISNIIWETTGGFTDNTLIYGQIIDWINVTCTDINLIGCNITVINPNDISTVNNVAMGNISSDFSYTTDLTLDIVGTWVINITGYDDAGNINSASQNIIVSLTTQDLMDGFFGYDTETIPTNSSIGDLASYDYDLLEIYDTSDNLEDNWSKIKESIVKANELNVKIGLKYFLSYDLSSDTVSRDNFRNNITDLFDELLISPYIDTIEYIKIDVNLTAGYGDTEITDDNLDLIGKDILDATGNYFSVYSNYNSSTLDDDYIQYENDILNYLTASNRADLINKLANLTREKTTKTRIYYGLDNDMKTVTKNYQNNVMIFITEEFNTSTAITQLLVSELDNGDLIVYNNQSTAQSFTYDLSNGIDVVGKDIWDYTQGILLDNSSNGTITFITIPAYSAIIVGTETIDRVVVNPDLISSGTAFKTSGSIVYSSNHTDGIREGASEAVTSRALELWDNSYTGITSQIYYGWLNVSGINSPYQFDGLTYLIIADKNDAEIDKLFWDNVSIAHVFGYVAVADYVDDDPNWLINKKAEVDVWTSFNESINIFLDGLDAASVVNASAFEKDVKILADYVKIAKARELGINVFTEYQSFAQLSSTNGFAMKESCVHRWQYVNGANDSDGYNYSNQFWEDSGGYGDYNKSIWYNNHNINLICVPFINRTTSSYNPDNTDYSLMQKLYFKARVLGYEHIAMSTPVFDIAYYDKYYNIGTKLQSEPTVDGTLYSMRYTLGTVYYNSTSDIAWFDDGLEFNSGEIDLVLYDDSAHDYDVCINDYCDYVVTTEGDGFSYDWYTIDFNESVFDNSFGHYLIQVSSSDGGFIGDDTNSLDIYGKHSYYDNSGTWSVEADSASNHMYNIDLNLTYTTTLDTTEHLTQTEVNTSIYGNINEVINVTISAVHDFNTKIWTYATEVAGVFHKVSIYNGGSWIELSNYSNSTSCLSTIPNFLFNTIAGIGDVGLCIDTSDGIKVRMQLPQITSGTDVVFQVNADDTIPVISIDNPLNINYSITTIDLDVSASEEIDSWWYSNNSWATNTTFTPSQSIEWEEGSNMVYVGANDTVGNIETSSITFFVDSINPQIEYSSGMSDDGISKNEDWIFINVSITETNEDVVSFRLYDSDYNLVNETNYSDAIYSINFTSLSDGIYHYNVSSYDIVGNVNSTDTNSIILDLVSPIYSNDIHNNSVANLSTSFSIELDDNHALHPNGQYIFSTNNSGTWINDSIQNFTQTLEVIESIKLLNDTIGISIGYRWFATDNIGNVNNTEIFTLTTTDATTQATEGQYGDVNWTTTSNNVATSYSDELMIFNNTDVADQNISVYNLTNALLYNPVTYTIYLSNAIFENTGNFTNITIPAGNKLYLLNHYNVTEGSSRSASPIDFANTDTSIKYISSTLAEQIFVDSYLDVSGCNIYQSYITPTDSVRVMINNFSCDSNILNIPLLVLNSGEYNILDISYNLETTADISGGSSVSVSTGYYIPVNESIDINDTTELNLTAADEVLDDAKTDITESDAKKYYIIFAIIIMVILIIILLITL